MDHGLWTFDIRRLQVALGVAGKPSFVATSRRGDRSPMDSVHRRHCHGSGVPTATLCVTAQAGSSRSPQCRWHG